MARMKFLCDADRCIDCNACVTACKNENEVPWGINRRRVVTINDGKPGERSVSMACMHCTDAPCAAVCPVTCIYPTEDGIVLHDKDLCIGCGYCFYACPFGAPQYPQVGNFGSRGKMDKCTYCAGGGGPEAPGSAEEYAKYGSNRFGEGKLPMCAEMCSTKSLLAGDGDIIAQIYEERVVEARLWLRSLGLDNRLSRGHQVVRGPALTATIRDEDWVSVMTAFARIRFVALLLMLFGLTTAPVLAQKLGPDGAPNPTASVTNQKTLLEQAPRIEGRIDIPDVKASVLMQPAGRTWDYFHEVLLHWGGAVVIVGMLAVFALAYLIMGRLRIEAGRSGRKIVRFKAFERFSHWLTAVSFVLLGLTGLNITFGKIVLLPLVGPDAFSDISQVAKYVHNFTSFAFVAGLVLITVLFFRDNLFRRSGYRLGQAGWRLHQVETCACRTLQSR